MNRHHLTMTSREKLQFVVDKVNEGYSYRDIAYMMGYKSSSSVAKLVSDAKSQDRAQRLLRRWGMGREVPGDE